MEEQVPTSIPRPSTGSSNTIEFHNVAFRNFQGGRLALSENGLAYHRPASAVSAAAAASQPSKIKRIRWESIVKHKIAPPNNSKHLLKIFVDNSTSYKFEEAAPEELTFVMNSRGDLEQIKVCFTEQKENNKNNPSQPILDVTPIRKSYTNVRYKGMDGGRLVLTPFQGLTYISYYNNKGGNAANNLSLDWVRITHFRSNPIHHLTALLRIVATDSQSHIFEMKSRSDLDRARADIRDHLMAAAAANNGGGAADYGGNNSRSVRKSALYSQMSTHGKKSKHQSVHKTLGSFGRLVGPAADIRELEYISALHQNAERFLRSDGTISSEDIIPYVSSRYGLVISKEQAVDIACNLCGAKPRNELSAQIDAHNNEIQEQMEQTTTHHHLLSTTEGSDKDEDDDDDEEVYYFDLVQVMSLLMIPELLQISSKYHESKETTQPGAMPEWSDLRKSVTFTEDDGPEGPSSVSTKSPGIVKVVIESLIEIFDEELQRDIRSGLPLDADMMRTILESVGDVDAAENPDLIQQMLDALSADGSPSLTVDNFFAALADDVRSYTMPKVTEDNGSGSTTTTFFDVFGRNWDEKPRLEDYASSKMQKTIKTAPFIDYAADTYLSAGHNTIIWCLFILTTLIYLTYVLGVIQAETGGLVCSADSENFGCAIGNKVLAWLITATFCGLYGMFFILPTSMGNVASRKGLLAASLLITATLTFLPFSLLVIYEQGIPHNSTVTEDYRTICPGWVNASDFLEVEDPTRYFMTFDAECMEAVDWCEYHQLEIQGKVYDQTPDEVTYDEFERCYDFLLDNLIPAFFAWEVSGAECFPDDLGQNYSTCPGYGACAQQDLRPGSPYVCCHSGDSVTYETTSTGSGFNTVCDSQPVGAPCISPEMCESRACLDRACVPPDRNASDTYAGNGNGIGEPCDRDNRVCESNFCRYGVCQPHPRICPLQGLEFLGGFRIDPYCRTVDEWCDLSNLDALTTGLFGYTALQGDDSLPNDDFVYYACEQILDQLINVTREFGDPIVIKKNVSDAELVVVDEIIYYNKLEEVLMSPWSFFILLCTAVVGGLAVLVMAKNLFRNANSRHVRDYHVKCAAAFKVARVIENALSMHMVQGAGCAKGQVMRNYFLHGEQVVEVGGLPWTIQQLVTQRLFKEEGIRFSGRIWIGQVVQTIVTVVAISAALRMVQFLAEFADDFRASLSALSPVDLSKMDDQEWLTVSVDKSRIYQTAEQEAMLEFIPEYWMVKACGLPAAIVAGMVAIFCICVYVPSYTNKILKYRAGMLPSLHDIHDFDGYRWTADNVVQNVGNMVFSLLGAMVFTGAVVFVILFIFIYPITRPYALSYVAVAIGIICTILIKMICQKVLRARNFSAFYRKNPNSANYANLFFECWYLGTGLLMVVSRLINFLIAGALWLGRIDVEYMHPNVKIFGAGMDKVPAAFTRDMLGHEAHSHPYIDRLGGMYLTRIRDGEKFGSVAGTTWRALFVTGLMPWIVKYRANAGQAGWEADA